MGKGGGGDRLAQRQLHRETDRPTDGGITDPDGVDSGGSSSGVVGELGSGEVVHAGYWRPEGAAADVVALTLVHLHRLQQDLHPGWTRICHFTLLLLTRGGQASVSSHSCYSPWVDTYLSLHSPATHPGWTGVCLVNLPLLTQGGQAFSYLFTLLLLALGGHVSVSSLSRHSPRMDRCLSRQSSATYPGWTGI